MIKSSIGIKQRKLLYFLIFILFSGDASWAQSQAKRKIWTISMENIKGESKKIFCEVVETEQEKRRGLMFRDKLEPDECMIFLYDVPIILSFWMKNTYLPLSIAFVDETQEITDIFDMKPLDESIISSTTPGIYAIEVNRGWFKKNYVYRGSKIKIIKSDVRIDPGNKVKNK